MRKNAPLLKTVQAREAEKLLIPAIKQISGQLHTTGEIPNEFEGYKLPAGTVTDRMGRKWQLQVHAVVAKSSFIKNEVVPMIKKGAILVRLRIFLKYLVDWANR